jgi:hypothetical protein
MTQPAYPKTLHENLQERARLLLSAKNNPTLQAALNEMCRRDRLYWINLFCYTYDPRTELKHLPFITYDYQDDTLLWDAKCSDDGVDNLLDKSRDMGATWIFVVNDVYDWLFKREKIEIRWGSRKEQYVDTRGDMDSIFEKLRYIVNNLPYWMLPKGYNQNVHDNSMRLINPETGSSITGEATNANFGRGGRKFRLRFDEFAYWENDVEAWEGCADVTKCRTALSTPNGSSNKFAMLSKSNIEKRRLHWTLHPDKSKGAYYILNDRRVDVDSKEANKLFSSGVTVYSDWYNEQLQRRTPTSVAQELDIDYLKSGRPYFDMVSLNQQKVWEETHRMPGQEIPYGKHVKGILVEVNHETEFRDDANGWVKMYEEPKKGYEYVLGADVSEGLVKGDMSSAVVREKFSRNVVATVNLLVPPEDYAFRLFLLHKLYNCALTAIENNNHGYAVCKDFQEMGGNIYMSKPDESLSAVKKRGWSTTPKTRPVMLAQNEEEVRKFSYQMRDAELIEQHKTFITNDKGKCEADGLFKDDFVMATSICGCVINENPIVTKKVYDNYGGNKYSGFKQSKNAGFSYARR